MNEEKERIVISAEIKHWEEEILSRLRTGKKINGGMPNRHTIRLTWNDTGEEVKCFVADSPLCNTYSDFGAVSPEDACGWQCPYMRIYRQECSDNGQPWAEFLSNPTLGTATAVVDRMRELQKIIGGQKA